MTHTSRIAFLALALAACNAGSDDQPPYALDLVAADLPVFEADLHVSLVESDGDVIIDDTWFPVEGGALDASYPDLLAEGVAYRLDLYFDLDADGLCDAPPDDRVWQIDIDPVVSTVLVDLGAAEQEAAGCDFFVD